mmetsp:Transcript_60562/g.108004  ORF Transcript_60562/g.108004 Transcript_60562/m.108004 type:complete len:106 (+) Transcript_60562:238-555(+)
MSKLPFPMDLHTTEVSQGSPGPGRAVNIMYGGPSSIHPQSPTIIHQTSPTIRQNTRNGSWEDPGTLLPQYQGAQTSGNFRSGPQGLPPPVVPLEPACYTCMASLP